LLIGLAAMLGLHFAIPGPRWGTTTFQLVGGLIAIGGLLLTVSSAGLFRRRGTEVRPFQESSFLVITGPYRFTRNAMYLGMVLILAGIGVLLGSTTPLAVVPMFVVVITRRFIHLEERALSARFGAEYDAYRARVRRWI
jgi:protein-S-isoprenylcysteine O-methyltransferase Ste14